MKFLRIAIIPCILLASLLRLAIPAFAVLPQYSTKGSVGGSHSKTGTTGAVTMSFLTNGIIQIKLNNQLISSGTPMMQNVLPTLTTGVALSPTHGQLTQLYVPYGLVITYDCVLNGTDLTISATVQNNGIDSTVPMSFLFTSFVFSGTPTGTIPFWNYTYVAAQGVNGTYHPSVGSPLGCVYAGDSNYAVSIWSPSELAGQALIQATWASDAGIPNPMPIELHTLEVVPPGSSAVISLVIRVTTDQSPAGLLSGYKLLLPVMSYTPVNNPVVYEDSSASIWVTPQNPYGYDGAFRRLDWPQGVQSFVAQVTPLLQANNAAGVIFWAPGGYQTTTFWPVDIDVNLSRIATTWPILVNGFKANNYRVGSLARLGDTLNADGTWRRADFTNSADVDAMIKRVDYVAATGVDMWYIDSACNDFSSTQMTAIAKNHLKGSHIFYSEFCNDMSMSFAGVYCEWTGNQTMWVTELTRSQLVYLYPNSTWLCKDDTQTLTNAQIQALGMQPLLAD